MKRVFLVVFILLPVVNFAYPEWEMPTYAQHDTYEFISLQKGRSHHASTYDVVLQEEHHPFLFTPSPLGNALRLSSYLLGELYAAAEDGAIYDHVVEQLDRLSYRVLDLYALHHEAQKDVVHQLQIMPEKQGYLLPEVAHLQERIERLSSMFMHVMGSINNEYVSTIRVTLRRMSQKTDQLLAQ